MQCHLLSEQDGVEVDYIYTTIILTEEDRFDSFEINLI